MQDLFEPLQSELRAIRPRRVFGTVAGLGGGLVSVTGLSGLARLGDAVCIRGSGGRATGGEVQRIGPDRVAVLTEGAADGHAIGDRVELLAPPMIAPHAGWIGRIVDPSGQPLDGRPLLRGALSRPLHAAPPAAATRRRLGGRLDCGMAVFNTLLPLVRGQRIGLFAGSGVGKSSLLGQFARRVEADVVVIALIGERGRELRDFAEDVLGQEGMARGIIVAATADQSPLVRRRCAWTALAVAEHFRDAGRHVLLIMDSVTRFAEAHREITVAAGETAGLRGFPPSTPHLVSSLAERAGPGPEATGGDITAVFSVLVAGSDMDEPLADMLRGVLDGHVVLDRAIAERGRFPAVDLLRSVSRSLPAAATNAENALLTRARQCLATWEQAEAMVRAGLYAAGSDPEVDIARAVWPALDTFIGRQDPMTIAAAYGALTTLMAPALRAGGRT